jgi:proteasome accessory factor PafA2
MSVHRIMGIETEYGISVPGHPTLNAMVTSSQIVNAYSYLTSDASSSATRGGKARSGQARWDYDEESPLRDARGYDMSRAEADPSQLTDEDLGLANVILTNGARLYVDHAHPEYSSPEVTNPRDAVLWDRAGVAVMHAAAQAAAATPGGQRILLYKNNTDNKGASYGTHENYLMRRSTPFSDVVRHMTPFFITRQVFTGAGRLGVGQDGRFPRYQLSQRADFFEVEVGLETTLKRPIINTRDEPHADPEKYRRLHVIVGDANLSDTATYLKMGTTAIVLSMIEDGFLDGFDVMPTEPVAEMHRVSHDVSLRHVITLADGRSMTAVDVQRAFLDQAWAYCDSRWGSQYDEQTKDVLAKWGSHLDALATEPTLVADTVDWVAKLQLIPQTRWLGVVRPPPCAGGSAVLRYPTREGPRGETRATRSIGAHVRRPGSRASTHRTSARHSCVLPGPVHEQIPRVDRRCVLGLGGVRSPRTGRAPARAHHRADSRHQGPRRSPARPGHRCRPTDRCADRGLAGYAGGMAAQENAEHKKVQRRSDADEVEESLPSSSESAAETKEALDADVDSILDEIDEVLEENAEDFVKSFVQKGGQ